MRACVICRGKRSFFSRSRACNDTPPMQKWQWSERAVVASSLREEYISTTGRAFPRNLCDITRARCDNAKGGIIERSVNRRVSPLSAVIADGVPYPIGCAVESLEVSVEGDTGWLLCRDV